jgi:hypothetical protein
VIVYEYLTMGGLTIDVIAKRLHVAGEIAAVALMGATLLGAGLTAVVLRKVSGRHP